MESKKHVVVIGAGIVGLSTAYYALQKGHRLTVLERSGPDHEGCSLGNAGMIVPSHFIPLAAPGIVGLGLRMLANPESPFWIRPRLSRDLLFWTWKFMRAANAANVERAAPILRDLHLASRACYEELSERVGEFGLVKKGLLMMCETENGLKEERHAAEMARKLGLPGEVLNAEEVARLEPDLEMKIAGAVYYPQDCYLDPRRALRLIAKAAEAGGADIRWNTAVTSLRTKNGRVEAAITGPSKVEGDEFVIAAGSWSPTLARSLSLRLPMLPGKGYSLTLPSPPQLPAIGGILMEARVAVTPIGGSLRFAGTMELGGLDLNISSRRINGIIRSVCRAFPAFTPEHFCDVQPWCGLRPCSPDGLPYIGRFSRYSNLSAATGHAMMGLSLGPITGKLIAETLSGEKPSIEIAPLSPDRYALHWSD